MFICTCLIVQDFSLMTIKNIKFKKFGIKFSRIIISNYNFDYICFYNCLKMTRKII